MPAATLLTQGGGPGRRGGELAARWRAAERVAAWRRAVEVAGGGEDEGARRVEAGAAKTRWHGAGDGGAPVSGLAGSSSKAAGVWRRRSSGGARGRRRSRRRDGRRRRRGTDQENAQVLEEGGV